MRRLVLCAAALLAAGCGGPKMGQVSGTVKVDGKPVAAGTITFVPSDGKAAIASIENGRYALTTFKPGDGALVGTHKVTIHATKVGAGSMVAAATFEDELKNAKGGKVLVPGKVEWIVPERYSALATTDLTRDVKPGEQAIDFDLPAK